VDALSENGPDDLKRSIHRRVTHPLGKPRIEDAIHPGAVDLIQMLATCESIEPAQVHLVCLNRRLVARFLQPANDRIVPCAAWSFTERRDAPRFGLQPVMELLREGSIGSPSRLAYSQSIGTDEVDPPDAAASAK